MADTRNTIKKLIRQYIFIPMWHDGILTTSTCSERIHLSNDEIDALKKGYTYKGIVYKPPYEEFTSINETEYIVEYSFRAESSRAKLSIYMKQLDINGKGVFTHLPIAELYREERRVAQSRLSPELQRELEYSKN